MAKAEKKEVTESWDDLEIFTSKGARLKNPLVTIMDNSTILFNTAFVHQASILENTHVILGYSEQNNAITMQFTKDKEALGALTLVNRGRGSTVVSNSFFSFNFLQPHDIAGKYIPRKVKIQKIGEVWVIDLDKKTGT